MADNMKMQAGHADIDTVFRQILTAHGREEREGQIRLCHDMFDAMAGRKIVLCDAGVGIGKTDAYLVAAVLFDKRFPIDERINDYYGTDNKRYPFVITTSSIALQKAILEEYIPFLSDVLYASGMIEEPFTGQVQKGKENYVCRQRLIYRLATQTIRCSVCPGVAVGSWTPSATPATVCCSPQAPAGKAWTSLTISCPP